MRNRKTEELKDQYHQRLKEKSDRHDTDVNEILVAHDMAEADTIDRILNEMAADKARKQGVPPEEVDGYRKGPHWICFLPLMVAVLWGDNGEEMTWIHVSQLE